MVIFSIGVIAHCSCPNACWMTARFVRTTQRTDPSMAAMEQKIVALSSDSCVLRHSCLLCDVSPAKPGERMATGPTDLREWVRNALSGPTSPRLLAAVGSDPMKAYRLPPAALYRTHNEDLNSRFCFRTRYRNFGYLPALSTGRRVKRVKRSRRGICNEIESSGLLHSVGELCFAGVRQTGPNYP